MVFLGVNIDHVATVRNARGGILPDPVQAALLAEQHGADGITAHLREDRRHIKDSDMAKLKASIQTRLNMEMANTPEMLSIAEKIQPYMVTLVPERRQELTTEGGLDVLLFKKPLQDAIQRLGKKGIRVSLFIDPDFRQVNASYEIGAKVVELHTGRYCDAKTPEQTHQELDKLMQAARQCVATGIEVNAGHGLNYENVQPVCALPGLVELNIGHSIIAEAIFTGLGPAVRRMKELLN